MTTQIDNWEGTFHCGECESEFTSVGYDNPVFYADKVADCPKCGSKCWENEHSKVERIITLAKAEERRKMIEMIEECKPLYLEGESKDFIDGQEWTIKQLINKIK